MHKTLLNWPLLNIYIFFFSSNTPCLTIRACSCSCNTIAIFRVFYITVISRMCISLSVDTTNPKMKRIKNKTLNDCNLFVVSSVLFSCFASFLWHSIHLYFASCSFFLCPFCLFYSIFPVVSWMHMSWLSFIVAHMHDSEISTVSPFFLKKHKKSWTRNNKFLLPISSGQEK